MTAEPRRRPFGRIVASMLVACAAQAGAADGVPDRCSLPAHAPAFIAANPVELPDMVFDGKPVFHAKLRFRVDADGRPGDVSATVTGIDAGAQSIVEKAVADAFGHFRFCPARADWTETRYKADLMFSPARKADDPSARAAWYLQQFVPAYIGNERPAFHSGRTVVRATYAVDGRARAVAVVTSSGDPVLDDKSLDSMASAVLLFPAGAAPTHDISVVRPFDYRH